jgi:hypothetical protein
MGSQTNGAGMPWDSGVPGRSERGERLGTRRMMRWTLWLESICLVGFAAAIVWIVAGV